MTTANYLTKALVMYDSLQTVRGDDFHLYYFAFDDATYDILKKLNYPNITVIHLHELEGQNDALRSVKEKRSKAEYFFTCTPQIIDYCLKKFHLNNIVYVDADLYFYADPKILFDEMKGKSVLITEHNYYPPVQSHPSGRFCVQFVPFINNGDGNEVLADWKGKCLDWCYMRAENGKWADQGYLTEWPERFSQVHIMQNPGAGLAGWNIDRYRFKMTDSGPIVYDRILKKNIDLVFFHFHGLKIYENKLLSTGIPKNNMDVFKTLYEPYIKKLSEKESELINMLNEDRKILEYESWRDSFYLFIAKEIKRLIIHRKKDIIYCFKMGEYYRWLP